MSINTRNLILYSERNGNNSTESSFISARVFHAFVTALTGPVALYCRAAHLSRDNHLVSRTMRRGRVLLPKRIWIIALAAY